MTEYAPSPSKAPASVALTPGNVALLVTAILGLVSMGMFLRTLSAKMDDMIQLQRENRATLEMVRSVQQDIRSQQDWILRQRTVAP